MIKRSLHIEHQNRGHKVNNKLFTVGYRHLANTRWMQETDNSPLNKVGDSDHSFDHPTHYANKHKPIYCRILRPTPVNASKKATH